MEGKVTKHITIEDAKLIFKNFQGREGQYNAAGNRNFGVLIPNEEMAETLADDGWNIKYLKPREDDPDQEPQPWLSVKVQFGKFPPTAVLITSRGKIPLDEETIGQIDWAHIETCDVRIRPYNYPAMLGRPAGVSAYLHTIYVKIYEDDLAMKYADVPEI